MATIANVTAVLVDAGWTGGGLDPRWWRAAVILAGAGIGTALTTASCAVPTGSWEPTAAGVGWARGRPSRPVPRHRRQHSVHGSASRGAWVVVVSG